MDKKIDSLLLDAVLDFLKLQAEARASKIRSQNGPDLIVLDAFRRAFQNGGLDEVDNLIDIINKAIKLGGGSEGLGEGAAFQQSDGKHPAFLHIFFANFSTGKVLARESIALQQSSSITAPD